MRIVGGESSQIGSHETLDVVDLVDMRQATEDDMTVRDVITLLSMKREQKAILLDQINVIDYEIGILRNRLPAPAPVSGARS